MITGRETMDRKRRERLPGGEDTAVAAFGSTELAREVPREILVAPWGEVASANGTFVFDDEAARLTIEAFAAHGTDVPVDYEHQTLGGKYASPTGQAPAAGWIRWLTVRRPDESDAPGLYAGVEWTEPAAAQIASRQYRYLSPVAIVRKSDGRMAALHSAALTNKPAIAGMRPIVNRLGDNGAPPGRPEREEVRMDEAMEQLRQRLGLDAACGAEAVMAAASERLAVLEDESRRREAESRVLAAMEAGKLAESQREWAVSLALRDAAAFEAWEASAPVIVCVGRMGEPGEGRAEAANERVVASRARAEFRLHPELALVTSEEAYVALALRDAGLSDRR